MTRTTHTQGTRRAPSVHTQGTRRAHACTPGEGSEVKEVKELKEGEGEKKVKVNRRGSFSSCRHLRNAHASDAMMNGFATVVSIP